MAGEIAGKQFPKAICSSYFQANTQAFMLAVIAAFLKSALLTSVLVCIEIEKAESRRRGTVTFICGHIMFHHHSLPFLLQHFPLKSCYQAVQSPRHQHRSIHMKTILAPTKVGDRNEHRNEWASFSPLPGLTATSVTSKASLEALRREFSLHWRRGQ